MDLKIDEKLLDWATDRQREYITTINLLGGVGAAARHLSVDAKTIRTAVERVRRKGAAHGYSPQHDMTRTVPEPFVVRGNSTYYNKDGKVTQQWVKSRLDDEKWQEAINAAVSALAEELPRLAPTPAPRQTYQSLANLYPLTDVHLGMLAWHEEGGADWDLKIAEQTVTECFMMMMDRAPQAGTAIIAQLGDWLHSDGIVPVTPASQHVLDQDSRFQKVVRAGVRLMRRIVDEALKRHEKVVLLMAEGNHDTASSVWMQTMFAALYENEPRVEVVESALPYYAMRHGKTALFFHHGHKKNLAELPMLMAGLFGDTWGYPTKKRYIHVGHRHHVDEKDRPGVRVVQHPTLAAKDAYSARGGWLSERQASAITYHSDFGEVGRVVITPEMLQEPA